MFKIRFLLPQQIKRHEIPSECLHWLAKGSLGICEHQPVLHLSPLGMGVLIAHFQAKADGGVSVRVLGLQVCTFERAASERMRYI